MTGLAGDITVSCCGLQSWGDQLQEVALGSGVLPHAAEAGAVVCVTCQLGQAVSCDTLNSTSSPMSLLLKSAAERRVGLPVQAGASPSFCLLRFCFHNLPILGFLLGLLQPLKPLTGWHMPVLTPGLRLTLASSAWFVVTRSIVPPLLFLVPLDSEASP